MDTVGEQLRSARLAKNLTIEDVVEKTKIRGHFIRCMEDQELGELPSGFAAQSFLRQYALLLELDADRLVRDVSISLPGLDDDPEIVVTPDHQTPSLFFVKKAIRETRAAMKRRAATIGKAVIALGLIVTGSTFWFLSSNSGEDAGSPATSRQSPVPTISPPVEAAVSAPIEESGTLLEVEIEATDRVWVRWVIDAANEGEATLNAGERKLIQADAMVQTTIGDAAAVNLVVNGELQAPLGLSEQVRHLEITREGLTRVPPDTF